MVSHAESAKRSRRVAPFLFLGLLTSIAIAWSVAAFRPPPQYPRTVLGAFEKWERPWSIAESHSIGAVEVWWMDLHADDPNKSTRDWIESLNARHAQRIAQGESPPFGPDGLKFTLRKSPRSWSVLAGEEPPPEPLVMGADAAFGWPMLCLSDYVRGNFIGNSTANEKLHGGWLLTGAPSARGRNFTSLPLRPIWWGLILNTLIFACLWWLAFFATSTLRRSSRRRRGRCLACGYDLRGNFNQGCPECGWQRKT